MEIKITRPQGTEDVTPKQIYKWHTVERIARETAESFGFHETRIPTFENTNLFLRSVGETTDVVQKEMYTVKAKETEFTLRPENSRHDPVHTPERSAQRCTSPEGILYPVLFPPRASAGRQTPEFHQFGIEMAGSQGPTSDAEIIALAKTILDRAGLKNIVLNINSIGCPTCRAEYHKALRAYFEPKKDELCETCLTRLEKNPMRILDCKSPICAGIAKDAPVILDYLCDDCRTHFEKLQEYLKALHIDYSINPKIVRGLDYYTKTVFEFITTDIGAQGTVCGGGRYDGLIEQMGGKPTPAMGFAMGLERLIMTMEQQGCAFEEPKGCDLYIAPMDESAVPTTMQLGQQLRVSGYQVEYDVMQRGLKAQMKYANKIGAAFVMVLGENELQDKKAKLKNMETGEQIEIALDETFEDKFDDIAVQYMFHDIVEDFEKECQ
ncbi:MAG: histidine--tRNA ligase [Ruminococcus callidus]